MESLCGVRNIKKEKKTVEVATEYEAALCGAPPIVDPKDLERNFSNELPSGVFQREKERERERERETKDPSNTFPERTACHNGRRPK